MAYFHLAEVNVLHAALTKRNIVSLSKGDSFFFVHKNWFFFFFFCNFFSFYIFNIFFVFGKLLVHRYGIYCIAFTRRTKNIDDNGLLDCVWERLTESNKRHWMVQNMEMVFFIYQNAKPWLPLVIAAAVAAVAHNLNAVRLRWCQCTTKRPPLLLSVSLSLSPPISFSLTWRKRDCYRVMEPNDRLFHLTREGIPEPRNKLYFSNESKTVVVHCAHGCARVLAHMLYFQLMFWIMLKKERKKRSKKKKKQTGTGTHTKHTKHTHTHRFWNRFRAI